MVTEAGDSVIAQATPVMRARVQIGVSPKWRDYIIKEATQAKRIDPAKVLLIVNSNSSKAALSSDVANYYQQARGLGDHRLEFDLGSGTSIGPTNLYTNIVLPVANYIANNGIEAVVVSAGCPMFADVGSSWTYGTLNSFDALLGGAVYCRDVIGKLPNPGIWTYNALEATTSHGYTGLSTQTTSPVVEPIAPNGTSYDLIKTATLAKMRNGQSKFRPYGRIGVPSNGTPTETYNDTVRMIDDALWAESRSQGSRRIAVGVHHRVNRIAPPWQWMAYAMAKETGHDVAYYVNTWGVSNESWYGKPPDWDWTSMQAGIEHVEADGYIGGALINLAYNHQTLTSLYPKRGAWGWDGTSYNFAQVATLIYRGGCSGIATIQEPFENSLIDAASLMSLALKGWSLAEINYLGQNQLWRMSVYGDPLYRPFPLIEGAPANPPLANDDLAQAIVYQLVPLIASISAVNQNDIAIAHAAAGIAGAASIYAPEAKDIAQAVATLVQRGHITLVESRDQANIQATTTIDALANIVARGDIFITQRDLVETERMMLLFGGGYDTRK
jgi:hypothetical protein